MFNDFERVKTEEEKKEGTPSAGLGAGLGGLGGELPPGMQEGDLNNLEKQFMGMFQNITK